MDPVPLISLAYSLYERIDIILKTAIKNKKQFELLRQRIEGLSGPIKRLQDINKSTKNFQCTDQGLKNFVDTLKSIELFVSQPRLQKPDDTKSLKVMLHYVSLTYHASEDEETILDFDRRLSNHIHDLNFGITVSKLDYGAAATKDKETIFKDSGLKSKPDLRHIDLVKLHWNPNKISERLGQGAFSVVWRGKYDSQSVAIKQVLNLTTLSWKDIRTITKEALVMQFSDHAHVLKVVGVCLPQGLLVMELALCSLSEYLYRPPTTVDAVEAQKKKLAPIDSLLTNGNLIQWKLEIILQICDALQYLHSFNILHRDIKSPNVMLFIDISKNKVIAKIGDFGLALAVDFVTRSTTGYTATKMAASPNAVGTYNYMAPELFERQPGERVTYSESSDVYSLGILINEIMSSTVPWGGGVRDFDIMNWVVYKSMRPEMWTVSTKPTAAEMELFAIVGSSDSAQMSCLHQSHQHRPSAYDVYTAANGRNPWVTSPPQVPAVTSVSMRNNSYSRYEQIPNLEAAKMSIGDKTFSIGLCEIGDCCSCLYSWCCCYCALASSRTALDGSSWCFNLFCLNPVPYHWQVRSAYGIGDSTKCCFDDCFISCCCPCCSTNQIYQMTRTKGNPTPDGGLAYNTNKMTGDMGCDCCSFLKICFCSRCVVGDIVQNAYGMPWYLGCCCVGTFYARNTVRYHYRLETTSGANECVEECLIPIAYCQWVAPVTIFKNLNQEVKFKSPSNTSKGYLVGFNPQGYGAVAVGTVVEMDPKGLVKA